MIAGVRTGTKRDAILFSVSANAAHGLRRTNEDKRRAVMTLLNDAEWRGWSDREIARRCNIDPSGSMVGDMRRKLILQDSCSMKSEATFTHPKTGMPTQMRTENIGKSHGQAGAREHHEAHVSP